jgi:organic hydroperoxide reductase OsmC/OhrA
MELPHVYRVAARSGPDGRVKLSSQGSPELESSPPIEFGGPGDRWSPEGLLIAAVVDCLSLSFRAIAAASSFRFSELRCSAEATLDRVDGGMRFTEIVVRAELEIPSGERVDKAERLLQRAERSCPVSSSLATPVRLEVKVSEA